MARFIISILVVVVLMGCISPKAFDKPGLTLDQKPVLFAKDYSECEDQAYIEWSASWYKKTGAVVSMPRPVPTDSIAGVFIDDKRTECLQQRGWIQVDLPDMKQVEEK